MDAIDPKLVKSLELHKLTKVESRNRPGQTFELLKIPIELTVSCDDLAKTEETKSNMSCAPHALPLPVPSAVGLMETLHCFCRGPHPGDISAGA